VTEDRLRRRPVGCPARAVWGGRRQPRWNPPRARRAQHIAASGWTPFPAPWSSPGRARSVPSWPSLSR